MSFTEEEAKKLLRNRRVVKKPEGLPKPLPFCSKMNKTEQRYVNEVLDPKKYNKEIREWKFEPFNIRLADRTFYRVDFLVISNVIEFHEVKGGFVRDDAIVKWKVAADQFPWFKWVLAKYKQDWQILTYRPDLEA